MVMKECPRCGEYHSGSCLGAALHRLVMAIEQEHEDGTPRRHSISVNLAIKHARRLLDTDPGRHWLEPEPSGTPEPAREGRGG